MPPPNKSRTLTVRCPPVLRRKLNRMAKAENRTVSNLVIKILTEAVQDNREPATPSAEEPPEP